MSDKPGMDRKVYVLPSSMTKRMRAYQERNLVSSEVEAARRLISRGLQMDETVADLLVQLGEVAPDRAGWASVLASHIMVTRMDFAGDGVVFVLRDGSSGEINKHLARVLPVTP